jgi:quercetin dioxygenase-like cupin family protein
MLIRRASEMDGQEMAMEGVQDVSMRLMVGRSDGAPNFSMRHFTVGPGGHTPRHQHDYEHEVYLLKGEAQLEHDGQMHEVTAGDVLYIEPNAVHQFVNTGEAPLEFLCLVPVTFDCGKPTPGS